MSEVYGVQWNYGIDKTYRKPQNFTNHCNNDQSTAQLQLVDCPSVCILMIEKVIVGGEDKSPPLFLSVSLTNRLKIPHEGY